MVKQTGNKKEFWVLTFVGISLFLLFILLKQTRFQTNTIQNSLAQTTSNPLPGDANNDLKVDGIDYTIWLFNYNTNKTGPQFGDFNSDNKVDGVDFVIWLSNYGRAITPTPPSSVTTTISPTPSPLPSVTPTVNPASLVKVQGDKLFLGGQEYIVKGANFVGGRYLNSYYINSDGQERMNRWQVFHDFDKQKIGGEIAFLKGNLGINTIRIFTPTKTEMSNFVTYLHWDPWFNDDGTITTLYKERLRDYIRTAYANGVRVHLELLHNFTQFEGIGTRSVIPGSDEERFYKNYVRSVAAAFKDEPGIIAYEIGNETLVKSAINYNTKSGYESRVLSFTKRMVDTIRSADTNHLITSGEIATPSTSSSLWHWPSPEFAVLSDIDSINNGTAFSLYSIVDYIAPHFYGAATDLNNKMSAIQSRSVKPVVLGETGYFVPDRFTIQKESYKDAQTAFFTTAVNAAKTNHMNGILIWDPEPLFTLLPGTYTKTAVDLSYGKEILLQLTQPRNRTILGYNDTFELFDYNLQRYPAATVFFTSFP